MCFDLGRSDYDKHNVRDSARNTTCPFLLNTKCRNCGYFGHTTRYCKMPSHLNPVAPKHIHIVKQVTKPKNAFQLLCMELDEHEDEEEVKNDEEVKNNDEEKNDDEKQEEDELPDLSKVLWGKRFTKKSWADQVEEHDKKNSRTWAQQVLDR